MPSLCWHMKAVSSLKLSYHTNGVVMLRKSHRLASSCSFHDYRKNWRWVYRTPWALSRSTSAMEMHEPGNWLHCKLTEPELCRTTHLHQYTRKMGQLAWQSVDEKVSYASNMHGWGYPAGKHGLGQKEHLFPSPSELKPMAEFKDKYHYLKWTADSSDSVPWLATHIAWQLQHSKYIWVQIH